MIFISSPRLGEDLAIISEDSGFPQAKKKNIKRIPRSVVVKVFYRALSDSKDAKVIALSYLTIENNDLNGSN